MIKQRSRKRDEKQNKVEEPEMEDASEASKYKEELTGQNAETLQVGLENNSNDIEEHQLSTFKNRLKKEIKKEIA